MCDPINSWEIFPEMTSPRTMKDLYVLDSGGTPKTRKRNLKNTSTGPANSQTGCDGQSTACSSPCSPKRRKQKRLTNKASSPVHSSSTDHLSNTSTCPAAKRVQLDYTKLLSKLQTSKGDSGSRSRQGPAARSKRMRKYVAKEQMQTCSESNSPPAKCGHGKKQKMENLQTDTTAQSLECSRPRFELENLDVAEQDESLLSSDLSIELSHHEEQLPDLSFQEDEESEEEEDLPSFLMQVPNKKPTLITEGVFVWHKYRNYPFWPALVKSVNRKLKKASIVFIDHPMIHQKKGGEFIKTDCTYWRFTVALKTLKPFDCEEADELVCKAKENYDAVIEWSVGLITDYRIRIACGSFSGSFMEYFAHDMSYPVRRKYPQTASERLTITTEATEELCDDKDNSYSEQQEKICSSAKRLLPDRTHAAHNRANEKLVDFIVKQRKVEDRLLAVIRGQQQSRWLRSFQRDNRKRVVNIYLEDDCQLDQVYWYLSELYSTAVAAPCPAEVKSMERVPFVLDVLLPEAIIYAIAGVDKVSLKKAEEKYLKGRSIGNRERQEFDLMIEQQMKELYHHD